MENGKIVGHQLNFLPRRTEFGVTMTAPESVAELMKQYQLFAADPSGSRK